MEIRGPDGKGKFGVRNQMMMGSVTWRDTERNTSSLLDNWNRHCTTSVTRLLSYDTKMSHFAKNPTPG